MHVQNKANQVVGLTQKHELLIYQLMSKVLWVDRMAFNTLADSIQCKSSE